MLHGCWRGPLTEWRPAAPRLCQHIYPLRQQVDPGSSWAAEELNWRVEEVYLVFQVYIASLFKIRPCCSCLIGIIGPVRRAWHLRGGDLCTFFLHLINKCIIILFYRNFPFKIKKQWVQVSPATEQVDGSSSLKQQLIYFKDFLIPMFQKHSLLCRQNVRCAFYVFWCVSCTVTVNSARTRTDGFSRPFWQSLVSRSDARLQESSQLLVCIFYRADVTFAPTTAHYTITNWPKNLLWLQWAEAATPAGK